MESNPYILKAGAARLYLFDFDVPAQQAAPDTLFLQSGSSLLSSLPASDAAKLSEAASLLGSASASLGEAKAHKKEAHRLSLAAQSAVNQSPVTVYLWLQSFPPYQLAATVNAFLQLSAGMDYFLNYEYHYQSALSSAATSFDSTTKAGRVLSQGVQSQYEALRLAGAGNPSYSGPAKGTFLYASSLLSGESGFCAEGRRGADAFLAYAATKPRLPNFESAGLPSYLARAAGGGNSTLSSLADLYLLLSQANAQMESEYALSELRAEGAAESLSLETASLSQEDLQLIGDIPLPAREGQVLASASYGGIYSGYLRAKSDLESAQSSISLAKQSHSSKAEGHTAIAISYCRSAEEQSGAALSSLSQVRLAAQAAVEMRKDAAGAAISLAEARLSGTRQGSLYGAQAASASQELLQLAREEYQKAAASPSLGKKYSGFADAERLASQASSSAESAPALALLDEAQSKLASLSGFLKLAKEDGLDVAYEEGKLSQLHSLISGAPSAALCAAVAQEASSLLDSAALRLYAKYSSLEESFPQARGNESQIAALDSSFSCGLAPYSGIFREGRLDAKAGAGRLKTASSAVSECNAMVARQIPRYLSAALSLAARASEQHPLPLLGRPTPYYAEITTGNPSGFVHAGGIVFHAATATQLYSSDFAGGDAILDAYPDSGMTAIKLQSVGARQSFSMRFEKNASFAPKSSSADYCPEATAQEAPVRREIAFFAPSALRSLGLAEEAPPGVRSAQAAFQGATQSLSILQPQPDSALLSGTIHSVPQGKNSLTISFIAGSPFAQAESPRTYETAQQGGKRVSFELEISGATIDCSSALVRLDEPYSSVAEFNATSLSSGVSLSGKSSSGGSLSFSLSPLRKGQVSRVRISFLIPDPQAALAEALAQAEWQAAYYNRTRDALSLAEAKALISQNRTNEALSLLSQMRQEGAALSAENADFGAFKSELSSAQSELASARAYSQQLAARNFTDAAASLSGAISAYQSSQELASSEADAKGYSRALQSLRKAKADFSSALSEAAWGYLSETGRLFATAQKQGAQLPSAQARLSEAERLFSEGDFLGSMGASAETRRLVSLSLSESQSHEALLILQAEAIRQSYSEERTQAEALIAKLSSQYSSLSSQGRRSLPLTPSEASSRLSDADKLLEASKKASLSPAQSLSGANASYQRLLSLVSILNSTLSSLEESAASSLSVARAALSQARQKSPSSPDLPQLEAELARAESLYADALYADSINASDRIASAAAALLSSQAGIDPKHLLIGAVSVALLAAAAYCFTRERKAKRKEERRGIPKAE
jgi:hypothetical protein